MSRPPISHVKLSPTLSISECHDGFWIYDKTRGMNLAMRAKTRDAAFVEVITYYQERLKKMESSYADLTKRVEDFVTQFPGGLVDDES